MTNTTTGKPETNNDEFWGPNWSDWKPPPIPSQSDDALRSSSSILDAPITEPGNVVEARSQNISGSHRISRHTAHSSDSDSDGDYKTSVAPQPRANRPERLLPDQLEAIVLQPASCDANEMVDRIFDFLANPPRRKRFVPDEDWNSLGTEHLPAAVERHVKLFKYLVRENDKIVEQAKQMNNGAAKTGGGGIEIHAWAQDENLEVTLAAERSLKELRAAKRDDLVDCLRVVKLAREHLLEVNDEMKMQIEEQQKR